MVVGAGVKNGVKQEQPSTLLSPCLSWPEKVNQDDPLCANVDNGADDKAAE